MADQEPHSLASTFPNPPPFWHDFTPDKLGRIEKLRSELVDEEAAEEATPLRVPNLPDDLTNLQAPPEPADGRWRVFGDQYMLDDKLPTLEDQGITNLHAAANESQQQQLQDKDGKHYDRALELKKLSKSLLLNFLELVGVMSHNPADGEAKVKDLRTLFINLHHILNEYRPHQARESAIEMMQDHLDRTRAETAAIRTQVDKARSVLEGLGSLDTADEKPVAFAGEEPVDWDGLARQRDADLWAATDAACAS
ncbi:hypothetical protein DCS_02279 [Drechmeria coniospora]|uniref:Mediator of RNA polymerase II transcription subunit 7 n=1 Tax=Drechmeria coniospora TaxID=98403 RepID=A0A151GVL5_DRECN|nr:hypothetical protein DCS_02279 [Drechmeria coniospora]KYK61138.1 hypothetical protein DCS_02279 [Drechmeria coniospora]ODA80905.1 hypothetical protein RJ55_03865 [Drechmeria coniospora]